MCVDKTHFVVDTSAWIEWARRSHLGLRPIADFPEMARCIMPTFVLCELTTWLQQSLPPGDHATLMTNIAACESAELDLETVLSAEDFPLERPGARMSDQIAFATARRRGVRLLTCNPLLEGLPQVIYWQPTHGHVVMEAFAR